MIAHLALEERICFRWQERRTPWVARITGRDPTYGFERVFLEFKRDYRDASSSGRSGVMCCFVLPEGYYEVREIRSCAKERRHFVRSQGGEVREVEKADVEAWLDASKEGLREWLKNASARSSSAGSGSTS